MKRYFSGADLYAKIRYNQRHNNSDLRWRVFVKKGEEPEIMYLCTNIFTYCPGYTYCEIIDEHGHYSIVYPCKEIFIDEKLNAWIK